MRQTEKFIKGALLLSIAGLLAKVASSMFKIPLGNLVGDEGLGYYQNFYPVFTVLTAAGLVGIPSALSKLVAQEVVLSKYDNADYIYRIALKLSLILGAVVSVITLFGAKAITSLAGWKEETVYVIVCLSISPVFMMTSGAIRGYFQGFQEMKVSAISQLIENMTKVVIGITLAYFLIESGYSIPMAVAGAAVGTSLGFVLSALYTFIEYKKAVKNNVFNTKNNKKPMEKGVFMYYVKRLVALAIPVSIASAVFSIMNLVDSLTIYKSLEKIGYNKNYVTELVGQMGKAISVINFPLTISLAIAMSMIPAITQAITTKNEMDLEAKINQGIKFALMIALPAATGLFILSGHVIEFLFPKYPMGGIYLKYYSVCLVFVIVGQTLAGVLQGISKQSLPVYALFISLIAKVVLNLILVPTKFEESGALIASVIYYILFLIINYIFIKKNIHFKFQIGDNLIKPLIANAVMIVVVLVSIMLSGRLQLSNSATTILSVFIGAICYMLVLLRIKGFNRDELSLLPKHEKIISILDKKGYFK